MNNEGILKYSQDDYDIDGFIRLVDSENAISVFMEYDEYDDKYYRNRYHILASDRGIQFTLAEIHNYLEQDSTNALFIPYAASENEKLWLLDGRIASEKELNLGELELGENIVYGVLVRIEEEQYVFEEVSYYDGGEKHSSWTTFIEDAGVLSVSLRGLIEQFA